MQASPDGGGIHTERRRDLGSAQTLDVVEHQHGAVDGGEPGDGGPDCAAKLARRHRVQPIRPVFHRPDAVAVVVERQQIAVGNRFVRARLTLTRPFVGGAGSDATEPAPERGLGLEGVTSQRARSQGGQSNLLGILLRAGEVETDPVEGAGVGVDEALTRVERVAMAHECLVPELGSRRRPQAVPPVRPGRRDVFTASQ